MFQCLKSYESKTSAGVSMDFKWGVGCVKMVDPENCLQIRPYQAELEKEREESLKSVMASVNAVRSALETLKSEVCNVKEVDLLRKNLFDIEEKIGNLKAAIKEELLTLQRNETSWSKDVHFMERRMEEWADPVDSQVFKPIKRGNYKTVGKTVSSQNAVVQFQNFLSCSGGRYGGWEEQDHFLFVKERTKYKKKENFFSALHSLLPDLSYGEIEDHENWYQKYETLKDKQKEAIQKWRLEKESQQEKEEKGKEENKKEKTPKKRGMHQRINITQRIKEWKNQQMLRKMEEEEREKQEKEKLKQEEKRKMELQLVKKLAVSQYKAEKLKKLQEILPKEEDKKVESKEAKARNKILLQAFRLKDTKYMEKKKVIRLQFESKSNDRLEKLRLAKPALEFILQRDPQRIFQPTLIWNQHCLEGMKRKKISPVFDLNSIPRLAIPEWRRELK